MAKRISELDIATSVSDSDFIPCVQGGVTKRATRAALYPDDVPVDTTSRIFDLTGDRVPPIPDDPAGVTYQNIRNFTSFPAGWNLNNTPTITYTGGRMRVVADGDFEGIFRSNTSGLCIVRLRVISGTVQVQYAGGQVVVVTEAGGSFNNYSVYSASSGTFRIISGAGTAEYEIEAIYIGTGAYLSKTIDRAGVPWTNYGALPVDGPFGKGLQFNGAQYMQAPGPMIGTTGTIAVMFTPDESFTRYDIVRHAPNNGYIMRTDQSGKLIFESYNGTAAEIITSNASWTGGERCAFVFLITPSSMKIYVNGVYDNQRTVLPNVNNNSPLYVGDRPSGVFPLTGTIHAIRADSRVWTDEEIARWSRDPYSEDSGLIDAFSLSFARLPTFADNAAAIAGNLPVGKLYRTSTGNVLVRY